MNRLMLFFMTGPSGPGLNNFLLMNGVRMDALYGISELAEEQEKPGLDLRLLSGL